MISSCMKDGAIVESGSHGELMSAAGEYAKLYKIQAQAFSEVMAGSPLVANP
jgi:ABC-type transport system involved in cytochrome bd biosynthesis fused ATPase/permease subunit